MSEPLRVGLVVEGPTDRIVFEAALPTILGHEVVSTRLQPTDQSVALSHGGPAGFGFRGVLGWCEDVTSQGGLEAAAVFGNLDVVIVQLDGDVARQSDVDCALPCPPPGASADALRRVLLDRLGRNQPHERLVLAIPMDAIEAWLLRILRDEPVDECALDPAVRFTSGTPRLVQQRGKKRRREYERAAPEIARFWGRATTLSQARRFQSDVLRAASAAARAARPD